MGKFAYFAIILTVTISYLACKDSGIAFADDKPETVHSVKYVQKENDWYRKQINLWKVEIDKDPTNTKAWYNYYKANRYYRFEELKSSEKHRQLNDIVTEMGKHIPESFEYHYLMARSTPNSQLKKRMEYAFKAYEIDPNRPEILYIMIDYYDMKGDLNKRKELYEQLYHTADLAPGLLEYNYNVLMSLEVNGILITNGDNDTYPALLLQDVFGIRDDVVVLNISMLKYLDGYLESRLDRKKLKLNLQSLPEKSQDTYLGELVGLINQTSPETPVYFALTVYKNSIKPFEGKLHIIGLAYKFDQEDFDNIAFIKKNLEQRLRLDYLTYDWYEDRFPAVTLIPGMNMNYTIPIIMLAQHYSKSGDESKADLWKDLALEIGEKADQREFIETYLTEKGL